MVVNCSQMVPNVNSKQKFRLELCGGSLGENNNLGIIFGVGEDNLLVKVEVTLPLVCFSSSNQRIAHIQLNKDTKMHNLSIHINQIKLFLMHSVLRSFSQSIQANLIITAKQPKQFISQPFANQHILNYLYITFSCL